MASSTPPSSEPQNALDFKEWLASYGGSFHPNARYTPVPQGLSIVASEAIEPDATIVTCPFQLIITPLQSKMALLPLLHASKLNRWSERQLMIVYICFHWIANPDSDTYDTLIHAPYVATLPSPDQLRTPLHFTAEELDALKGTNLYGAAVDRRRGWEAEWEQCRKDISRVNTIWGNGLTWERYLTASTYLSSRAFPSTLLLETPSLVQSPDSYPILVPGVDSLNHARAQPVSWVVDFPPFIEDSPGKISLVTRTAMNAGAEIFNNYGAKPNSELLLGYGFTLPANPDDTIVLKIGGAPGPSDGGQQEQQRQHEVGRGAHGAASVWDAIVDAVKSAEDKEVPEWQIILDSADTLRGMTESLLARLPRLPVPDALRRTDVTEMIGHYITGQVDVLKDLISFTDEREKSGTSMARCEGVIIQLDEDK